LSPKRFRSLRLRNRVKESGADPPPDERVLAFPITEDSAKWDSAKRHIRSLSTAAQAAIEGLQPHGSPEEFALRDLGGLEELDNADKHRGVRVVAAIAVLQDSDFSGLSRGEARANPQAPSHG
jgi:hypothetical protein